MPDNLFFALMPDRPTSDLLARRALATCRKLGLTGKPISAERLHVTLFDFDYYTPEWAQLALERANRVTFSAFEISFARAMSFKAREAKPFVLTSADHSGDVRSLVNQLATACDAKPRRSVTPHLTLVWDRQLIAPYDITPVGWTVRDIVLVRSFVGQSRYEILGRWPATPFRSFAVETGQPLGMSGSTN
jgi:2'-5' RNA ligase